MPEPSSAASVGLLFSGGLDSSILLAHLLDQGHRVQPIYIRCQLVWQREELTAARRFLKALASPRLAEHVILDLPLGDLYGAHWSLTGRHTPGAATPDDAVYLPGRNPLLLVKAAVWCHLHGIDELALAALSTNPFADATEEFFAKFQAALNLALSAELKIMRPFSELDKRQVMEIGRNDPLAETFSCIAPVEGRHCGRCNKCAERQQAFRLIAMADPTDYAEKMPVVA